MSTKFDEYAKFTHLTRLILTNLMLTCSTTTPIMEYRVGSVVRGYHIYQSVWDAIIGESLICVIENDNSNDKFAVAVTRNNTIVGHVPRTFSSLCSIFLRKGGSVMCEVTGRRQYSLIYHRAVWRSLVYTFLMAMKVT